jgi:hypothetical protein
MPRRFLIALFFSGLTGSASPARADDDLKPLLERAAARLGKPAYSGYVQTEMEEDLDNDGKVVATRMTKTDQTLLPDGTRQEKVLEAMENGGDVKAKVIEFRADRDRKARANGGKPKLYATDLDVEFALPFEAEQRASYVFQRVGGDALRPRIHFEPREKGESRKWTGEATLDAATGTLLMVKGHPSARPRFVDDIDIQMEFTPDAPPGPMAERMVVVGGGHFLFFHKRMRYTSVLSDFRPPHERP